MATPVYDALVDKVRDWSNKKEVATIPNSVIEDCLRYSADIAYRNLRIPPLEKTATYTVAASNNTTDDRYTVIEAPQLLTQFIYIRVLPADSSSYGEGYMFNEVTDARTFLDPYADKYGQYHFMWLDDQIKIAPQLAAGTTLEIAYYRRLPDLNATYSVIPTNYIIGLSDAEQPYLYLDANGVDLWFGTPAGGTTAVFATEAQATAYANGGTVVSDSYLGKESANWLKDSNERLLMWGALKEIGAYLFDDKMEARYEKKQMEEINSLNMEEKMRRAKGGNVQMHFNTNGLI